MIRARRIPPGVHRSAVLLRYSGRGDDRYRFIEELLRFGARPNCSNDFHSLDNSPEGRKTLAVRVPSAAMVEFWMVADTDEESSGSGARLEPRHGYGSVAMAQSGADRGFMGNGRPRRGHVLAPSSLDNIDRDFRILLIAGRDDSIKCRLIQQARTRVGQEIPGGDRSGRGVDVQQDLAQWGRNLNLLVISAHVHLSHRHASHPSRGQDLPGTVEFRSPRRRWRAVLRRPRRSPWNSPGRTRP